MALKYAYVYAYDMCIVHYASQHARLCKVGFSTGLNRSCFGQGKVVLLKKCLHHHILHQSLLKMPQFQSHHH